MRHTNGKNRNFFNDRQLQRHTPPRSPSLSDRFKEPPMWEYICHANEPAPGWPPEPGPETGVYRVAQ